MSLAGTVWLHAEPDQQGSSVIFGLGHNERYRRIPLSELQQYGLTSGVRSAEVFASGQVETQLMLFMLPFGGNYKGAFQQIGNPKGADKTVEENISVPLPGLTNFGATSALLVGSNRDGNTEARISLRQQLLDKWLEMLDDMLEDEDAERDGEPTMTWEMFPSNTYNLNEDRMYLRIRQNLEISVPFFRTYDAYIQYHLYLYANPSGNLRGHVVRGSYWVQSGSKSSSIGDRLAPKLASGVDTINEQLAEEFAAFEGLNFTDLYYLPGNQTYGAVPGLNGSGADLTLVTGGAASLSGFTTHDVTIVLELGEGLF